MKHLILKSACCAVLYLLLSTAHAQVHIQLNLGPAYESPYGSHVVWIPGHWDHGYWIPGQYVEFAGPPPGENFIWVEGRRDHRHGWRRGHWKRHHHRD